MIGQGALMIALLWGLSLMKTEWVELGTRHSAPRPRATHAWESPRRHGPQHGSHQPASPCTYIFRDTPTHLPMHGERPAVEDIHTFHDKIRIPHFLG
ncbi:hypothetical protein RHS01_05811 [Rhizoctonia solani]|uniref:Secreted protein n=1 Tax=Rhizoctonia solani TaxID=456999 RepID=A0A8H7IFV5_9AGAM|nr:hypothetical protein RHS01_05811 [Rhizoctonia solani]